MAVPVEGDKTFGAALLRLRTERGLSLADLSQLGNYSRGYLSKLENCLRRPNMDLAEHLDEKLGAEGVLIALARAELSVAKPKQSKRGILVPAALQRAPGNFQRDDDCLDRVLQAATRPSAPGVTPVVVLHGLGGMGKTAMALVAGHRLRSQFPGGVLFENLHGYSKQQPENVSEVLLRFLQLLGEDGDDIPVGLNSRAAAFRSLLQGSKILVVVDNASSSEQVEPLIPTGPGSAVIVTSRNPLPMLNAAASIHVGPLSLTAALRVLGDNPESPDADLRRIADRCAGIPIALRIAAGRLAADEAAYRPVLAAQLTEAPWPATVLHDNEQQLEAILRSTMGSVSAPDMDILTTLSQHPGPGLGAPAASWLLQRPRDVVGAELARLFRSGLLQLDPYGHYTFHDLIGPLVKQSGAASTAAGLRQLVNGYVYAACEMSQLFAPHRFRPDLLDPAPAEPLVFADSNAAASWAFAELPNIVKLCELAHRQRWDTACWQLAYSMRDYFFRTRTFEAWIATHRLAVEAADRDGSGWASAVSRNNLGLALVESGQIAEGIGLYRDGMRLFRRLDDHIGQAATYGHLAWAHYCQGKFADAEKDVRQALALYEQHQEPRGYAINLRTLGLILTQQHSRDAEAAFTQAMRHFTDLGLDFDQVMVLNCLGELQLQQHNLRRAARHFAEAARQAVACHSGQERARAIIGLSAVAGTAGHPGLSAALREMAQSDYAATGLDGDNG